MSQPNPFRNSFTRTLSQIWNKVSGIPGHSSRSVALNDTAVEIGSQRNEVTCRCGWHGKGFDSIKQYSLISNKAVEIKLFCKECKKYLGFIIYKDAA